MPVSRRTALKALGVAGGLTAVSGTAFATGHHADDERHADDHHDEPTTVPESAVRVAHFSPDAPNVDVLVDGEQLLADVAYGDVSPYLELEAGTYAVTITAAGEPETVAFEEDVDVGDAYHTAAAIGSLEPPTDVTDRDFTVELLVDGPGADDGSNPGSTDDEPKESDDEEHADEPDESKEPGDEKELEDEKGSEDEPKTETDEAKEPTAEPKTETAEHEVDEPKGENAAAPNGGK